MPETVNTREPVTLKKGDTIGLAPLAGPFQAEPYQRGITLLRDHGFRVKTLQTSTPSDYLAGSDAERLAIFHELWRDARNRYHWRKLRDIYARRLCFHWHLRG